MIKTKLRLVGNSIHSRIPKPIVESLKLSANMEVHLSLTNGCLIAKPASTRPHYTLTELLTKCNPSIPITPKERQWLDTQAVGKESI